MLVEQSSTAFKNHLILMFNAAYKEITGNYRSL